MVNFLFIWIGLVICLADALGDDFWVAFFMASILAIRALHTGGILQKVTTKGTPHDIVELLRDKFVSLLFNNNLLLLADSSLTIKPKVEWPAVARVLDYTTC